MNVREARMFTQGAGWWGHAEAHWDEAHEWAALQRRGHPQAQDFEPSGKSGSDPTSLNGLQPDTAVDDLKEMRREFERAWRAMERLVYYIDKHRRAQRPKPDPNDMRLEYCVLHWQLEKIDGTTLRYRLDLCEPCYKRKLHTGDYPTLADVDYKERTGRWPKLLIDPKQHRVAALERIASVDRLQLGTDAIDAVHAARMIR